LIQLEFLLENYHKIYKEIDQLVYLNIRTMRYPDSAHINDLDTESEKTISSYIEIVKLLISLPISRKEQLEQANRLLQKYNETIESLRSLPEGQYGFEHSKYNIDENGKRKGYSNSSLNSRKKELEALKARLSNSEKSMPKLELRKDPNTNKLIEFLEKASLYINEIKEEYLIGNYYAFYYFNSTLDNNSSPSLGGAILSIQSKGECILFKQDDHELGGNFSKYIGWFKQIDSKENVKTFEFSLESNSNKIIFLTHITTHQKDEISGFGNFTQFNGRKIFSSRVLLQKLDDPEDVMIFPIRRDIIQPYNFPLSESWIFCRLSPSIDKKDSLYSALRNYLSLKKNNYIESIKEPYELNVKSSEFDSESFYELNPPVVILETDDNDMPGYQNKANRLILDKNDKFSFRFTDNKTVYSKTYSMLKEMHFNGLIDLGGVDFSSPNNILTYNHVSYFIQVTLRKDNLIKSLLSLGGAIKLCKRVLFIVSKENNSKGITQVLNRASIDYNNLKIVELNDDEIHENVLAQLIKSFLT
jgi:hypothetical protein